MFKQFSGRGLRAIFACLLLGSSFVAGAQTLDFASVVGTSQEPGAATSYTTEFRSQAGNAVIAAGNVRLEVQFPVEFTAPSFGSILMERREGPDPAPYPPYAPAPWNSSSING